MVRSGVPLRYVAIALMLVCTKAVEDVHILYLTDCRMYSDWQAVAMAFSFRNSGQKGHITRVMCCTDQEKAAYNHDMLELMPSHVAPSFAYNNRTKDDYAAYNKPGAVLDFMTKGKPLADYILVIDSDMQLRHPFQPDKYNMTRGKAISADYTYMIGCSNGLAGRHIPEVPIRNDTLAGPLHRFCDMVGGYTFMHRDDLSKVAPLWLSVTEDVREDPEAWRLSGDQYVKEGGKPWISEMYGYSFACAKSGVWHTWDTHVMHYPGMMPSGTPKLIHYGLLFEAAGYKFDKHWHYDFDVAKCPPWDLTDPNKRTGGVFAHPPRIASLANKDRTLEYYRDLLSLETVATMNAGLCDYHLKHCPPDRQLLEECTTALEIYDEFKAEVRKVEGSLATCADHNSRCAEWLKADECNKNKEYMERECRKSCGLCTPPEVPRLWRYLWAIQGWSGGQKLKQLAMETAAPARDELESNLKELAKKLGLAKEGAEPDAAKAHVEIIEVHPQPQSPASSPEPVVHSPAADPEQLAQAAQHHLLEMLKIKCYRGVLSLEQVKECLAAAGDGREYQHTMLDGGMGGLRTNPMFSKEAGRVLGEQQQSQDAAPVVSPSREAGLQATEPASHSLGKVPAWQALGLWVVLLGVVLLVAPSLRRRAKLIRHSD